MSSIGQQFRILGTAGHIDHGKSSLVKALTGIDPDRLPEEKARGMTIELGFAHFDLKAEAGESIRFGVVDVPGHERFIRTMVSGATGVDVGMLVVAADDGVMPQTREHVEILDLLGVRHGVIALNKSDLVDEDRRINVRAQIADLTAATPLAAWPVVSVSAQTGMGLDVLRSAIARVASSLPARKSSAIFRLAIDRVFAVQGRGTVVTGTVLSGSAASGMTLELQPGSLGTRGGRRSLTCRVREAQSHGIVAEGVSAGQRAALNITGLDRDQIERGFELCTPGYLMPARYMDAQLTMLARRRTALESFRRVRISMGTWENIASVVVLNAADPTRVAPGEAALVQLRFQKPVVASHGQRFIVREENAEATLGGGVVLRPVSRRISAREQGEVQALQRLLAARAESQGDNAEVRTSETIRGAGFTPLSDTALACRTGIEPNEAARLRAALRLAGMLTSPINGVEVHTEAVSALCARAMAQLARHHAQCPRDAGMPIDRLCGYIDRRSAAGIGKVLLAQLQGEGMVKPKGPFVAHKDFVQALSSEDGQAIELAFNELSAAGFDPPTWDKLSAIAGLPRAKQQKLQELARGDARMVLIGPAHFASSAAVERFTTAVRELGAGGRKFKLSDVRDKLGLSRRPVQTLLEYLDRVRVTRRIGDERVLAD